MRKVFFSAAGFTVASTLDWRKITSLFRLPSPCLSRRARDLTKLFLVRSYLGGELDDAVPAGRRRAIVFDDVDGQKVFHAVLGRQVMQQLDRFAPMAGEKLLQCPIIIAEMFVGEVGIIGQPAAAVR